VAKTFYLEVPESMYTNYRIVIDYGKYQGFGNGYFFKVYSNDGSNTLLHSQLIESSNNFCQDKLEENYKFMKLYFGDPNNFLLSEYQWYINSFEGDIYEGGWISEAPCGAVC
jgi:hypothetical protein